MVLSHSYCAVSGRGHTASSSNFYIRLKICFLEHGGLAQFLSPGRNFKWKAVNRFLKIVLVRAGTWDLGRSGCL